jgi:membrane protein
MNAREFLAVARATFHEFNRADVGFMAAALTYYTFLSLFPLILLGLIIFSAIVDPQAARDFIFDVVEQLIPGAAEWLEDVLGGVLEERESTGWLALVGLGTLAFSASGAFSALDKAINRAWGTEKMPNIVVAKLISFAMMGVIGILLILAVVISTVILTLQSLTASYIGRLSIDALLWQVVNIASSFAITVLAFTLLYRFVPRCPVRIRDVWPAALLTALVWTIAKEGFALFLGSSFANFSAVYGTLGAVIGLLIWLYISSMIILIGAEFSAETANMRAVQTKVKVAHASAAAEPEHRHSPWLSD